MNFTGPQQIVTGAMFFVFFLSFCLFSMKWQNDNSIFSFSVLLQLKSGMKMKDPPNAIKKNKIELVVLVFHPRLVF